MVREFIEGWDLMQILGEGTFAEVKLLVSRDSGEACAMKEIDLVQHPEAKEIVRKEICVHKLLKHRNIVQCYGSRIEDDKQFIFLEYCNGGELFDRIEPEVGMPEHQAQSYFNQLISGLDYLHRRGVAHRDIKPENLLLTHADVLKVSDFGMATVFRHQGKERLLERRCGTMPYIAPEVLIKPKYNAEPADLWSAGVVLTAMLVGELPWDRPLPDQKDFVRWKEQQYEKSPWNRVDNLPLSLLRKILTPHPSRRYTLAQIKNHIWAKKVFQDSDGNLLSPVLARVSPPTKRSAAAAAAAAAPTAAAHDHVNRDGGRATVDRGSSERLCASQPAAAFFSSYTTSGVSYNGCRGSGDGMSGGGADRAGAAGNGGAADGSSAIAEAKFPAFSQPAQVSDLYCGTQSGSTQTGQTHQTRFQRLVKRMTRLWVGRDARQTEEYMREMLAKMAYGCKVHTKGILTIECEDRRGNCLIFKAMIIDVDKKILVDFRLSRGCGIEFKKHFAKIKKNLGPILETSPAPILWPEVIPVEAIHGILV